MSQTANLRGLETKDCNLFALPYTGNDLALVVLLPVALDGLGSLEDRLTVSTLCEWLSALSQEVPTEVELSLPKLRMNCRLDLADSLSEMGMFSAFSARADFSGMSTNTTNEQFVRDVMHQTLMEVNEEGTEAEAVSRVWMMRGLPTSLDVNHPFLFLILERQTGTILFLGRVIDPTR
jgi:serpin B